MPKSRFKITKFTNPSGEDAYRVSGSLDGKQIRKNFKVREAAVAFRDRLNVQHLNQESEGQTVWTTLTHDQNRDAIAATNLLRKHSAKHTLIDAVTFFIKNYREAEREKTVFDAAREYVAAREKDFSRGIISTRQIGTIKSEFGWFEIAMGKALVSELTADHVIEYLESPRHHPRQRRKPAEIPTIKTWNNRRGLLNTFFEYCLSKKYATHNPIKDVPQHKVKMRRATANTLSSGQAADLMHFLETYAGPTYRRPWKIQEPGFLVPLFSLCLFAGVRPDWKDGEIGKLRPKDIDFKTNVVRIEPEVSKINEKRHIKLQPNLRIWLEKYPLPEEGAIPTPNTERILKDIRVRFRLTHDVLRHTYISMTVGAFRSVGDASLQAGNSESVIRRHYLDLKSTEEADEFWRILPSGMELPDLEKKDGRYEVSTQQDQ